MNENFGALSGNLRDPRRADRFFTYTTRSGKRLVAKKPSKDSKYGSLKKSLREEVRQAVTYAEFACGQPIYQCKAAGTWNSAYNLAVADYLGKPQVLEIVLRDWFREGEQKIHIKAKDNFMVISVRLVIRDADCMLEEGEAVQSSDASLWWTYTIQIPINRQPGLFLDAFAYDLPGNVGVYNAELR